MTRFRPIIAPLALAAGLAGTLGACETTSTQPAYHQAAAYGNYRGESGRVVSIRDVQVRNQQSGMSDGTLVGGGVGMAGGAAVGAAVSNSVGGAVVGQTVAVAQRDDGDIQMGDRVQIVYDRNGVAKAVRDTGYRRD
jgi:outer membrane lipoprotein SlyB